MASPDSTQRELSASGKATQVYGAPLPPLPQEGRSGGTFRSWPVLEQLPTRGAEADIYVVGTARERRVLKLYRSRIEPKAEVLSRIAEVSRANRRCFVEFYETGYDEETGRWYELQEFIAYGSLAHVPPDVKNTVQFLDMAIPELAEAISCLHENGIIHCDIKPANILVRSLEPLELVLTDFGISSLLASDASRKMTGLKGTPMYWAPESFSREIGRPCDWWGMGMVALELLVGEHPFDGLSDSQIIHRLTLGNVTVPDTIDPEHALLIKGLLTRDDSLRWGKGEIDRWLSGDRDIPVFYETRAAEPAYGGASLHFEGTDCHDAEEIARAYAASETPWSAPRDHIRDIRTWLESNLKFDEAARMARMAASAEPEMELFRYVHSNARLPFSLMGHVVTAELLAECARKYLEHRGTLGEHRITEIMAGRTIEDYCDIYRSVSGEPGMREQIFLLSGKPAELQAKYLDALLNPTDYLWPENSPASSLEELAEIMTRMGRPPLKREFFDDMKNKYAVPREIISRLESDPELCAEAASTLESWEGRGLMLPKDSEHSEIYENMSTAEYEKTGRVIRLGHTSAILDQAEAVAETLEFLSNTDGVFALAYHVKGTIDAMRRIPYRKVTPNDTAFLVKMTELLEKRALIFRNRWLKCAFPSVIAGAVFWFTRVVGGDSVDLFFRGTLLLSLVAVISFCAIFIRKTGMLGNWFDDAKNILLFLAVIYFVGGLVRFGESMSTPATSHLFSFSVGFVTAFTACCAWESLKISKNNMEMLEACEGYSRPKDAAASGWVSPYSRP
ncbi:MAG: protein kinase [Synergistaceae bacterium]|nr:protein kinase [Synergistaceae bacterium]